jgi:hypothetical protein
MTTKRTKKRKRKKKKRSTNKRSNPYFLAVLADLRKAEAVGYPFCPGLFFASPSFLRLLML